jgi:hypothetical protein
MGETMKTHSEISMLEHNSDLTPVNPQSNDLARANRQGYQAPKLEHHGAFSVVTGTGNSICIQDCP